MKYQRGKDKSDNVFKIILVGQAATGKSCLMQRYVKKQYSGLYQATIGTQFQSKVVNIQGNQSVKLQIWDTAGQESFRSIIRTFFRNASAVLLVYDITKESTLKALEHWITLTKQAAPQNALYALIGTHLDLQEDREVTRQQARQWMYSHSVDFFFETSAKDDLNVTAAFEEVGKRLFCKHMESKKMHQKFIETPSLKLENENIPINQCC